MSLADDVKAPIRHADRFFIGGQWVRPSSDATIKVIDSGTAAAGLLIARSKTPAGSYDMDAALTSLEHAGTA